MIVLGDPEVTANLYCNFSGQVWEHGGGPVPVPGRGQNRRQEQECNTAGRSAGFRIRVSVARLNGDF